MSIEHFLFVIEGVNRAERGHLAMADEKCSMLIAQ
jgi:hypothetical protein